MKIGIGCTTYKRPEMLDKFMENLKENSSYAFHLYTATDSDDDRRGVAYRKNECLRALKDYDHIFLFDDDCWPIKKGWEDFFINSGQKHLLFLNDKLHTQYGGFTNSKCSIGWHRDCGGVFMYMTKEAVKRVGAFDEKFEIWGLEHANYSIRILGAHGRYPMLQGTEEYLYSEDYSNPNHKSSISNEEKNELFAKNFPIFNEPIKKIYIPL